MAANPRPSALQLRADSGFCYAKLMRSAWEQGQIVGCKMDLLTK